MSTSVCMAKKRGKLIASGVLGGVLGRSVTLLAPLVVMPEMLRYLGDENFGIWMTAISVTSLAVFMDFGVGNGLLTKLANALGSEDYDKARGYVASAYVSLTSISILLLFALVFASVLFGYLWQNEHQLDAVSVDILAITLVVFLIGLPLSIIQKVMYACQRVWLSNMWQIISAVLTVLSCYVAIHAQLEPWLVILSYAFPPLVLMFLSTVVFFFRNKNLRPRLRDFSLGCASDLLQIGSAFFVLSILTSISLNIDNLIIAQRLGVDAVTAYAVPAKLASLLTILVSIMFMPLWAANGEAMVRNDYAWVRRVTIKMSMLGSLVVMVAGLVLIWFGEQIIGLWMHRAFEGQIQVLASLTLFSVVIAIAAPFNMLLNSVGEVRVQIHAWMLFMIVSIAGKYFFLSEGGLWVMPLIGTISYCLFILPRVVIHAMRLV